MKRIAISLALSLLPLSLGCQQAIPEELADARAAYKQAAEGPANKYDPAALNKAEKSLALAEHTYDIEGDSAATRDRAYVAMRQAQLATVQARTMKTALETEQLKQQRDDAQAKALQEAREKAEQAQSQLEEERQRRKQAEQNLADVADVTKDQRGTVITMTGSVLFRSGQAELLGPAQSSLRRVADALVDIPDAPIVVEGHTDDRGSEELNQRLSQLRAESVADFLEAQGLSASRITAVGKGESHPIASNATAEGRANNRRVEIVVGESAAATLSDSPGATQTSGGEAEQTWQPSGAGASPESEATGDQP